MAFEWTEEAIKTLKQMFHAGASFSEIGAAIGVTRNAAIGKCNRLGLKRSGEARKRCVVNVRPIKAEKAVKIGASGPQAASIILRIKARQSFEERKNRKIDALESFDLIEPQHIGLMELTSTTCRWPFASEGKPTVYCGCSVRSKGPYCMAHRRLAYAPTLMPAPFGSEEHRRRLSEAQRARYAAQKARAA